MGEANTNMRARDKIDIGGKRVLARNAEKRESGYGGGKEREMISSKRGNRSVWWWCAGGPHQKRCPSSR